MKYITKFRDASIKTLKKQIIAEESEVILAIESFIPDKDMIKLPQNEAVYENIST